MQFANLVIHFDQLRCGVIFFVFGLVPRSRFVFGLCIVIQIFVFQVIVQLVRATSEIYFRGWRVQCFEVVTKISDHSVISY
jgi:hypothetical protein